MYCFGVASTAASVYSDRMYGFGLVNTAKGDYPDLLWNVLFWGCLHSQMRLTRFFLDCIVVGLLTQPKATNPTLFRKYCLGVVSTANGDYLDLFRNAVFWCC